jgi:hypothetical protein
MSVTVQVTVVAPELKIAGASLVTVATPQLSAVTGEPSTTPDAVQTPASGDTLTATGQVMLGCSLSLIVMS